MARMGTISMGGRHSHLVEQRLKKVVVAAIHQGDVDALHAAQSLRGIKTGKTRATMTTFMTCFTSTHHQND